MKITQKVVEYVAELANLDLTDSERTRMEKDLNAILGYIDQLSELDTTDVPPMTQVAISGTVSGTSLRSDKLRECLPREAVLSGAPQTDGTFFRVPRVIER